MWKENKRQRGSAGESPSYNKIIVTLWETNNTLLLSGSVSVTSWQVHLKLITCLSLRFAPLLRLDPANTRHGPACPGSQRSLFGGRGVCSGVGLLFRGPWQLRKCLCQEVRIPHGVLDAGVTGPAFHPCPQREVYGPCQQERGVLFFLTKQVSCHILSSWVLFEAPWCWKAVPV